mgnify:CR=1 FL=1
MALSTSTSPTASTTTSLNTPIQGTHQDTHKAPRFPVPQLCAPVAICTWTTSYQAHYSLLTKRVYLFSTISEGKLSTF